MKAPKRQALDQLSFLIQEVLDHKLIENLSKLTEQMINPKVKIEPADLTEDIIENARQHYEEELSEEVDYKQAFDGEDEEGRDEDAFDDLDEEELEPKRTKRHPRMVVCGTWDEIMVGFKIDGKTVPHSTDFDTKSIDRLIRFVETCMERYEHYEL